MNYLQLSKHWQLEQRGNELYIFGGHDAIFTIELERNHVSFFADLKHNQKFSQKELKPQDQIALEQLLSAGVINPILAPQEQKDFRVKMVGKKSIISQIALDIPHCKLVSSNQYDLLILIRTSETMKSFLEKQHYMELQKPHVFLDFAYHHTISLGPLVFPGITSCLACLEGRIGTRWGDEQPPPRSQSIDKLVGFAREWLQIELMKLFEDEDYSLINKTIVYDAQNRTLNSYKLLTVPLCPYCKKGELLSAGRLEYTFQ